MKNFLAFLAAVLLGWQPTTPCALCGYIPRGPRHLERHLDQAHPGHEHAWENR